jgi:hypothetical protein
MKIWSPLIGISCLLATGSVPAGPPFVTDDPEPASARRMGNQCPVHSRAHTRHHRYERTVVRLELRLAECATQVGVPGGNRARRRRGHGNWTGRRATRGEVALFLTMTSCNFSSALIRSCWRRQAIGCVASAKVSLRTWCRFSRRRIGRSGRFTVTSVIGGKLVPKRAITFTPAQCSSVRLPNG